MTKSQNTKNEQQKDLCITSEQLTKQLATESLPEYTEFYVRKKDGSTDTQTWLNRRHSSAVEWWNTFNITEVLAPVPSYEEWEQLQNWADFTNDYHELREKLEIAEYKNAQLKELLKECELWFTGMVGNMNDKNVGEHNKSVPIGNFEYIFKEFSQKIKGVLK